MKNILIVGTLLTIITNFKLEAQQQIHDYGFEFNSEIPVLSENDSPIEQPWVGGMNFCQFSTLDANLDGIKDLMVFERSGNRTMIFQNAGIPDSSSYMYAKEYLSDLPSMKEWAYCLDYNNDGKEDVFTYTTGGIAVYKNTSSNSELLFERVTDPFIYSLQGTIYTNLYVTPVDLPAISDLDNDGDYDILTFWGLGQYVQFHKNLSMEKYGHADSLDYEMVDPCWGDFEESEDDNQLTLNIECPFKENGCSPTTLLDSKDRHTGSTLLAIDLDNDNDKDLLLGDIDYPTLFKLENGGDDQNAHISDLDTSYPQSNPIDLFSFPAPFYLDINNDEVKDLVVSPFDEKTYYPVSDNVNSSWLYVNMGTNGQPNFQLSTTAFLQEQMIDVGAGAYPVLLDFNNDGNMDIALSNFGYRDSSYYQNYTLYSTYKSQIALLKNVGDVSSPQFKIVTFDLAGISELNLESAHPTFADLDNDNDLDLITGNSEGTLLFFENISQEDTLIFASAVENYQSIDVGDYSTPQLYDINRDGLLDLLIGNKLGTIYYYENTGSITNPQFMFVTETLGDVDVRDLNVSNFGYSVPLFFEAGDEYRLFVGSESGKIHYYKNIDGNLSGTFELFDDNLLYINEGDRVGVAVFNFDSDQYLDLLVGNYAGGLSYYKGVEPPIMSVGQQNIRNDFVNIYPQPALKKVFVETTSPDTKIQKLTIYTLEGKLAAKLDLEGEKNVKLNINELTSGMYFLHIRLEQAEKSQFVVKKLLVGG